MGSLQRKPEVSYFLFDGGVARNMARLWGLFGTEPDTAQGSSLDGATPRLLVISVAQKLRTSETQNGGRRLLTHVLPVGFQQPST